MKPVDFGKMLDSIAHRGHAWGEPCTDRCGKDAGDTSIGHTPPASPDSAEARCAFVSTGEAAILCDQVEGASRHRFCTHPRHMPRLGCHAFVPMPAEEKEAEERCPHCGSNDFVSGPVTYETGADNSDGPKEFTTGDLAICTNCGQHWELP